MSNKKSFFERLTGGIRLDEEEEFSAQPEKKQIFLNASLKNKTPQPQVSSWPKEEEEEDGELTVDMYQTPTEIVIQTMVAGVQPENLSINITRDMVTIKGKREEARNIQSDSYFVKELYWGTFSRIISLPEEIDPEESEAIEKHGLLIIKLPKINKNRQTILKVKSF